MEVLILEGIAVELGLSLAFESGTQKLAKVPSSTLIVLLFVHVNE